jgi:hypothetical protein
MAQPRRLFEKFRDQADWFAAGLTYHDAVAGTKAMSEH